MLVYLRDSFLAYDHSKQEHEFDDLAYRHHSIQWNNYPRLPSLPVGAQRSHGHFQHDICERLTGPDPLFQTDNLHRKLNPYGKLHL